MSSTLNGEARGVASVATGQSHEDDVAKTVIVCAPSALSKMMGALHPAGALYEKPVNAQLAREAHQNFVKILKRHGVRVRDVRDILTDGVAWSVGARMDLEKLALKCLRYRFERSEEDGKTAWHEFTKAEAYYVSDAYKESVIEQMDEQQLVDIIFTHPTVTVCPSTRDTGFTARYTFEPLTNIVFVRDQQITARHGIVMARLRSPQRAREVDIMEFCLRKEGLKVVGRVPAPGHLEGGDFFPLGEELCLLGIGPRTDWHAAHYLLSNDLLGTKKVGIVRDEFEKRQERMHLDTVFNVIGRRCCVMLEEMMGEESGTKRLVDEYEYEHEPGHEDAEMEGAREKVGRYVLRRRKVELSRYLREKGWEIIAVSGEEQLRYGCNALNLGGGQLVTIERDVARRIAGSPAFSGSVELLDFDGITCMYGGVHCASQVVCRQFDS